MHRIPPLLTPVLALGLLLVAGKVLASPCQNNSTKLTAPAGEGAADDRFGEAVGQGGDWITVGVPFRDSYGMTDAGYVFVFEKQGADFVQIPLTVDPADLAVDGRFGHSVAAQNAVALVGMPHKIGQDSVCTAFAYEYAAGLWTRHELPYIDPNPGVPQAPFYGCAVDLGSHYAAIGAEGDKGNGSFSGSVFVYAHPTAGTWFHDQTLSPDAATDPIGFGYSVAVYDDSLMVVGAPRDTVDNIQAGAVYVYHHSGLGWQPAPPGDNRLLPADPGEAEDRFGHAVDVDSDYVIVGVPQDNERGVNAGAVYVFHWDSLSWSQTKLLAEDGAAYDFFGASVGISGNLAVVGAPGDDNACGTNAGSVYVFERIENTWSQRNILAPDCDYYVEDDFGTAVSIGPDFAVFGAPDDSTDQGDAAGAAYAFLPPYHDDRYFVHIADLHVGALHVGPLGGSRWKHVLEEILDYRPPPAFVVVAGDLVRQGGDYWDWQHFNWANYYDDLTGWSKLDIHSADNIDHLEDTSHHIPILFGPGNHDYRKDSDLSNYLGKITGRRYYQAIIGNYAVFSVDSGSDTLLADGRPDWPSGTGLETATMDSLYFGLDDLDGVRNGADSSSYVKVIFMHHPHVNPDGWTPTDGVFTIWNDPFRDNICIPFDVDFVCYGHLHKNKVYDLYGAPWSGGTKCIVANDAQAGSDKLISLYGHGESTGTPYSLVEAFVSGHVNVEVFDQYMNRDGYIIAGGDTVPQVDIPGSKYDRWTYPAEPGPGLEALTELSLTIADTTDYRITAAALEEDTMTLRIEISSIGVVRSEIRFEDVSMLYDGGCIPPGSVAELHSSGSPVELTIDDPCGGTRTIPPSLVITSLPEGGQGGDTTVRSRSYPNPFRPTTTIEFTVPVDGRVRLEIYDIHGRRVATVLDELQTAGRKQVHWNAVDHRGRELASGVYFYRVESSRGEIASGKMVLIR